MFSVLVWHAVRVMVEYDSQLLRASSLMQEVHCKLLALAPQLLK